MHLFPEMESVTGALRTACARSRPSRHLAAGGWRSLAGGGARLGPRGCGGRKETTDERAVGHATTGAGAGGGRASVSGIRQTCGPSGAPWAGRPCQPGRCWRWRTRYRHRLALNRWFAYELIRSPAALHSLDAEELERLGRGWPRGTRWTPSRLSLWRGLAAGQIGDETIHRWAASPTAGGAGRRWSARWR